MEGSVGVAQQADAVALGQRVQIERVAVAHDGAVLRRHRQETRPACYQTATRSAPSAGIHTPQTCITDEPLSIHVS